MAKASSKDASRTVLRGSKPEENHDHKKQILA